MGRVGRIWGSVPGRLWLVPSTVLNSSILFFFSSSDACGSGALAEPSLLLLSSHGSTMPLAGTVNESLSRSFAYKGPDGLTDQERKAHEICRHLSCRHEACYKQYMYSQPHKQKEKCGPLMEEWNTCFREAMSSFTTEGRGG